MLEVIVWSGLGLFMDGSMPAFLVWPPTGGWVAWCLGLVGLSTVGLVYWLWDMVITLLLFEVCVGCLAYGRVVNTLSNVFSTNYG
ncbi:unnamed protein product [Aspergillus oryzae var. brunneus]|uniref:Unnamed protein product n=1 Tax=Aspergillus oryzae var. brunneus TaxID=332754 RepID=A0ABQ6KH32_ASPOZ|nr:unnamed protein product [Aspergillus oryzae var. brunneus]